MPDGYEKKMSHWQIKLLERKLAKTDKMIAHRKWIASVYEDILCNKEIAIVKLSDNLDPVFLRYPILVPNKREVLKKAREKKLQLGDWFVSPVHDKLNNWEKAGYKKGMCPNAEVICEHVINLPTHSGIKTDEAVNLVEFISENYNGS
jgi:dTDP-4-amino-4,6-dideoxygalactose transaminase